VTEDSDLILEYLKAKKRIVTDKIGHEEVLCMASSNQVHPVIGPVERGKYDAMRTKELLESRVSEMETKCEAAVANAKKALKEGKRSTVSNFMVLL